MENFRVSAAVSGIGPKRSAWINVSEDVEIQNKFSLFFTDY